MKLYTGRGDGGPKGLPYEAVVQDLCDLRTHVSKMAAQVYDLKQTIEVAQGETLSVLKEILEATREGVRDAGEFRKDMVRHGAALLENTDAQRAAAVRSANGEEPEVDGVDL